MLSYCPVSVRALGAGQLLLGAVALLAPRWGSGLLGLGGAQASAEAVFAWRLFAARQVCLGGGALFGSVADTLARVANLSRADLANVDAAQALSTARTGARWGVLGLALSLAAAALGGLTGAKMWPRNKDADRTVERV